MEGMAAHSSILAWRNLWKEEPGRLQSLGLHRVRHDWRNSTHACSKSDSKNSQYSFFVVIISNIELPKTILSLGVEGWRYKNRSWGRTKLLLLRKGEWEDSGEGEGEIQEVGKEGPTKSEPWREKRKYSGRQEEMPGGWWEKLRTRGASNGAFPGNEINHLLIFPVISWFNEEFLF